MLNLNEDGPESRDIKIRHEFDHDLRKPKFFGDLFINVYLPSFSEQGFATIIYGRKLR